MQILLCKCYGANYMAGLRLSSIMSNCDAQLTNNHFDNQLKVPKSYKDESQIFLSEYQMQFYNKLNDNDDVLQHICLQPSQDEWNGIRGILRPITNEFDYCDEENINNFIHNQDWMTWKQHTQNSVNSIVGSNNAVGECIRCIVATVLALSDCVNNLNTACEKAMQTNNIDSLFKIFDDMFYSRTLGRINNNTDINCILKVLIDNYHVANVFRGSISNIIDSDMQIRIAGVDVEKLNILNRIQAKLSELKFYNKIYILKSSTDCMYPVQPFNSLFRFGFVFHSNNNIPLAYLGNVKKTSGFFWLFTKKTYNIKVCETQTKIILFHELVHLWHHLMGILFLDQSASFIKNVLTISGVQKTNVINACYINSYWSRDCEIACIAGLFTYKNDDNVDEAFVSRFSENYYNIITSESYRMYHRSVNFDHAKIQKLPSDIINKIVEFGGLYSIMEDVDCVKVNFRR